MRAAQAEIRKRGVVLENRCGEAKANPAVGIEEDGGVGMTQAQVRGIEETVACGCPCTG